MPAKNPRKHPRTVNTRKYRKNYFAMKKRTSKMKTAHKNHDGITDYVAKDLKTTN
jgi:hypothetical protein